MTITGRQLRAAIALAGVPYKTIGPQIGVSEYSVKAYCKRAREDVPVTEDKQKLVKIIDALRQHNVVFTGSGVKYIGG